MASIAASTTMQASVSRPQGQAKALRASSMKGQAVRMPATRRIAKAQATPISANLDPMDPRLFAAPTPWAGQGPPPVVPRSAEMGGDPFGLLLKKRIVFLGSQVEDFTADAVISQLLLLDAQDPEQDIKLFINSPGGSVTAGMGIYDAMQMCRADVSTVCFGLAASMGAFLLTAGTKGKRYSMPNSRIMIHQPLGGASGQAADIEIQAKEIMFHKGNLNKLIAMHSGKDVETVDKDTDRDYYMSPLEAKEYGLIDHIIGGDEAGFKLKGDPKKFAMKNPDYIKAMEEGRGDTGAGFTGKPVEPYMPTPTYDPSTDGPRDPSPQSE